MENNDQNLDSQQFNATNYFKKNKKKIRKKTEINESWETDNPDSQRSHASNF